MFKEVFLITLLVIVVQCRETQEDIPIARQGGNFPVPLLEIHDFQDFFDDRFYPDIPDENIKAVVLDNNPPPARRPSGTSGASRGGYNIPGNPEACKELDSINLDNFHGISAKTYFRTSDIDPEGEKLLRIQKIF
ncbi:hypothetical protein DMENIID0001_114970 [Sergentomyia squamirostris]